MSPRRVAELNNALLLSHQTGNVFFLTSFFSVRCQWCCHVCWQGCPGHQVRSHSHQLQRMSLTAIIIHRWRWLCVACHGDWQGTYFGALVQAVSCQGRVAEQERTLCWGKQRGTLGGWEVGLWANTAVNPFLLCSSSTGWSWLSSHWLLKRMHEHPLW